MTAKSGYSTLQISLHWLIAILIIAAWFTSDGMGRALEERIREGTFGMSGAPLHVMFGGSAFLLILIRVIVRWRQGAPGPVPGTSEMMELAAKWGHRVLYVLMVLTPVAGAVTWNTGFELPGEAHEILGKALMIVALGHAAVAIWHQFIKKDGTLMRMLKPEA